MATATVKQRTFLGHPLGLYVLFFTEMWERFSYYGMRALLILYMVNYFKWSQKDASEIYKVYTSFVYVTPILGGYLADRYLGNRLAVIIGAILMAIGHFLMAFEEYSIFMAALVFLILGNGFFKPNMSTQVGRLYPANDGRRDGAYTIFYMGINLGAFLSPLACGWLAENTVGGYHSGFTLAGIGMVAGLAIYLFGQPLIRELPHDAANDAAMATHHGVKNAVEQPSAALSEAAAAKEPSVFGGLSNAAPWALLLLGLGLLGAAPCFFLTQRLNIWDSIMVGIGGLCLMLMGLVCKQVQGGVRDRVLAILILGIFVMFFWAAFEQAGNVLNVWADQETDRYLTREAPKPEVGFIEEKENAAKESKKSGDDEPAPRATGFADRFFHLFTDMVTLKPRPATGVEKSWSESAGDAFNPVPTPWFQSINALAIFLIAPVFAWLWIFLDRHGWQPSIPMKMVFGLLFISASMAVMILAAKQENRRTTIAWDRGLPAGISGSSNHQLTYVDESGHTEAFHAGRLSIDPAAKQIVMDGVLDENERDRLIEKTAPAAFQKKVRELQAASKQIDDKTVKSAEVTLDETPPGFDIRYSHLKKSVVQYKDGKLIAYQPLAEKEVKGLLVAAGDPTFRSTVYELFVQSTQFRVSSWWLFWTYLLATLGELCLSPVGLSMVSKLAPAKFATMLMGVWLLTSAFGNFAAGALGEIWGTIPPIEFFVLAAAVVGGAAVVLLVMVRLVTRTMHGVK